MNIMISAATGGYGTYAVELLQKMAPKGTNIIVLVRNPEKAKKFQEKGIEVRIGDYADYNSLEKALNGVDRLLFVSTNVGGLHKNVVKAAQFNGVKYIAYTSIFGAEYGRGGLEINHLETEELLKNSGIKHAILRNSWYLEMSSWAVEIAKKMKKFYYMSGKGVISGALKREYAEVGVKVILDGNYEGKLDLAGNVFDFEEFAKATEKYLGEKLELVLLSEKEFAELIDDSDLSDTLKFSSKWFQKYTLDGNNGEETATSETLEKILGRKIAPLEENIAELYETSPY